MKILHSGITYSSESIYNSSVTESVSLISEEIACNTCSFQLKTFTKAVKFKKNDEVLLMNEDDTFIGRYFIENAKYMHTDDNKDVYQIDCVDIIKTLESYEFYGRYYDKVELSDVISNMFYGTGIVVDIPLSLQALEIEGYNDGKNLREALHNVCFSYGLIVDTSRSTKIKLKVESATIVGTILKDKLLSDNIDVEDTIEKVSATAYNWIAPKESSTNIDTLFEGKIPEGKSLIVTYDPHNYAAITNGTILSFYKTYAIIKSTDELVETVFTAKPYKRTELSEVSGTGKNALVIPSDNMINYLNVNDLIARVKSYYNDTHTANITMVYDKKYSCGDRVTVISKFGVVFGRISEMKIRYSSSTILADVTIRGKLVPLQEIYYAATNPRDLAAGETMGVI